MSYFANRKGVRFGEHAFGEGEHIPDAVREQYPGPFARALERGWVEELHAVDWDAMTVAELAEITRERGLEVEGTGAGGGVLKGDLIRALGDG